VPRTGHTSRLVPVGDATPAAGDAVSDISDVGLGSQPSQQQQQPGSVLGPQEGSREQLGHLLGSAGAAEAGGGARAAAGGGGGGVTGGSAGDVTGHPVYGGVTPESAPTGGKGGSKGEGKRKHAGAGGSSRKGGAGGGGASGGGEEGPSKQRRIDSIFSKRLASQPDT
jgi:hypothetical protein